LIGIAGKKVATKERRWYKDVGLGYKTPSEAINGTYIGAHTNLVASKSAIDFE
jgi:Ribosomal_S17 N-terminal